MTKDEFERLFSPCENAVRRFVYFKLPSKVDADDVLQDALLSAYHSRDSCRNHASFKQWLLRIVANKCNDFYRERARRSEAPLDEIPEKRLAQSRFGVNVHDAVLEAIEGLNERDARILRMYFLNDMPQSEIANELNIPLGTVKSRLHTAKQRFKANYPIKHCTYNEGVKMKRLFDIMPEYTIVPSQEAAFSVKWEELMGWFIVPRMGEKLTWAMYESPTRQRSEAYELEVIGRASVHGIEGVEIAAREQRGGEHEAKLASRDITRTFVAQLTDTHCRILAESHYEGGVKRFHTFLDSDDFLPNWGFGEDNCGNEINLSPKGNIQRNGDVIVTNKRDFLLDVVGRYTVTIGGKAYDCVCVIDCGCYNSGVMTEQYLDRNGRTVLWRRFNRDDWQIERYGRPWSEQLPNNERRTVNDETFVHWYDCISDYIL